MTSAGGVFLSQGYGAPVAFGGLDLFELELRLQLEALFLLREEGFERQEREHLEDQLFAELLVIHSFAMTQADLSAHHAAEIAAVTAHVRSASGLAALDEQVERLEEEVRLAHFAINNMQLSVRDVVAEKKRTLEAEKALWERERPFLERHVMSLSNLLSEQADRAGRQPRPGAAILSPGQKRDLWATSSSAKMIGQRSPPIEPYPDHLPDGGSSGAHQNQKDLVVQVASGFVMNLRDHETTVLTGALPARNGEPMLTEPLSPKPVSSDGEDRDDEAAVSTLPYSNNSDAGLPAEALETLVARANTVIVPPLQLPRSSDHFSHASGAVEDLASITASTNASLARARQLLVLTSPVPPGDLRSDLQRSVSSGS